MKCFLNLFFLVFVLVLLPAALLFFLFGWRVVLGIVLLAVAVRLLKGK